MANFESGKDIKEITEQLEAGVKEVFTSGKFADYLATMAKFYDYSANNCLLIMMQNPAATHVASYKKWQNDFKRQVRKGEKSIMILAPIQHKAVKEVKNEKGEIEQQEVHWLTFKAVPVFDISQTDGEELPSLVHDLMGDLEQYYEKMEALKAVSPVPIEFEDITSGAHGYFSPAEKRIAIKLGMSAQQTFKTTVHEIAHAILHCEGGEQENADRDTMEVQAESVAYTVCTYMGIETSEYSFGYVAGWSGDKDVKQLTRSLEVIRKTAKTIIDGLQK